MEIVGLFFKLVKFCIVGFSGMIIDFFFTWLCKERLKWNKFVSNSIGFILAATSNYILNRIWTFESKNQEIGREYTYFFVISMIGLGLNNLIIYLLHEKKQMNFYLSKVIAIIIVTFFNFSANALITFRT